MPSTISLKDKVSTLSEALRANIMRRKLVKSKANSIVISEQKSLKITHKFDVVTDKEFYIGLMSGTSLDGVDASLISTDAVDYVQFIHNFHLPYPAEFRAKLQNLINNKINDVQVADELTNFHIEAIEGLIVQAAFDKTKIKAIGFHGQTIYHDPSKRITIQIGSPELIFGAFGCEIIYDFRSNDVANGGQGAPLVPIFHKALMANCQDPVAILNIGGVANITYIDGHKANIIAFDTGPGNAIINDAMFKYYNLPYDEGGKIASKGIVNQLIIEKYLESNYFEKPYPKSLDRNHFCDFMKEIADLSHQDKIATITYFTIKSIIKGLEILPDIPLKLYICGGGARNTQMINWLKSDLEQHDILKKCQVLNISEAGYGFDPDFIESGAFAYLAARFKHDLPSSFPSTTGVKSDNICGRLYSIKNEVT